MDNKSLIRIAVIGDSGVGKTSLIIALANESFPGGCPPVLPPVTMPAEYMPDGMPFQVIDTCTRPEERNALEQICLSVDVILLLFAAASMQSMKRLETNWLPELRRIGVKVPVLLVASKTDLSHQGVDELYNSMQPIAGKYKSMVEHCQQCSAKLLKNVSEVFYYAVKSVINPSSPIFDPEAEGGEGGLTTLCAKALKRIFIINDRDKDGALNDAELNRFQMDVFSAPLQPEEMHGLQLMVSSEMPQGVTPAGLTLPGFLYLHSLFIEKGSLETVWAVLRRYGYNNDVRLDEEVLGEVNFAHSPDQVIEMTEACTNFLSEKFMDFDEDNDKLLNASEQAAMFSTAPKSPWGGEEYRTLMTEVGSSGQDNEALTLPGFLSKWAFTTAVDPHRTLEYLRYLGFEGSAQPLFKTSKLRRQERSLQQLQRSVLKGLVVLGRRVGKGVLLRALANRPLEDADSEGRLQAAGEVAATLTASGGSRTVILQEIEAEDLHRMKQEPGALQSSDFALFTFSGSNLASLHEAERSMLELAEASDNTLPCALVNFEESQTPEEVVREEYGGLVARLDLRLPIDVSKDNQSDLQSLLQTILQIAEAPEKFKAIPQTPSLKAKKEYQRTLRRALYILGGGVILGAAGYAVYHALEKPETDSDSLLKEKNGLSIEASSSTVSKE